jgi:hypothetical protein
MHRFLLASLVLIAAISAAAAIQCYVCKSHDHVGCADPFDPIRAKKDGHLKECNHELFAGKQGGSIPPQNATFFCRKGYQNVREKKNIYRSCGWEQYYIEGRQCYFTSVTEIKTTQCACFEDGCNAGSSLASSVAAVALLSVLGLFFGRA